MLAWIRGACYAVYTGQRRGDLQHGSRHELIVLCVSNGAPLIFDKSNGIIIRC